MTKDSKRKPVIYIVDDDDGMRRALTVLMTTVGYQPEAFARRPSSCRSTMRIRRAAWCSNVRMPEMNGLEVQQELNRSGALIPVI
jgi:FixJ family two-component response regulator